MKFTLQSQDPASKARSGLLSTDHGDIQTPIFMPVGTIGSVRAVPQPELKEVIDADILGSLPDLVAGLDVAAARVVIAGLGIEAAGHGTR